jgi:TPR repeat protein
MKQTRLLLVAVATLAIAGSVWVLMKPKPEPQVTTRPVDLDKTTVEQAYQRASTGDVPAQLQLGLWALEGAGQLKEDQAAGWLRKAAAAGNAEAQYRLGTLYQTGRGLERDFTNALAWFRKAADQNHVGAIFNLGSMLEAGQGGPPDTKAAAACFLRAAELGDAYAQYNLARRSEEGHGVPRDLVQAWKWYELADAGGVPDTLRARKAIASRLTADEMKAARKAVQDFRKRFARMATGTPSEPAR